MSMEDNLYWYRFKLTRSVDGDTLYGDLDKGLKDWNLGMYVRLARINAPELATPEGQAAKVYMDELLKNETALFVRTNKTENYGRLLGEVYRAADGLNLSDAMVSAGHAVYKKY